MTHKQPDYVVPLKPGEQFSFSCHKGVRCFTECCRMLELALTPYDVLRLRKGTGLSSTSLLEQYIIEEQEVGEPFPRFYLTMVDDGRGSCVFVAADGCTIYPDRPSACRTYPLGRAAMRTTGSRIEIYHVLMKEPHCQGFAEPVSQDVDNYTKEQQIDRYNKMNDRVALILQHEAIRQGFLPSRTQVDFFRLALYDLDNFRSQLDNGKFLDLSDSGSHPTGLDDEALLLYGIELVEKELYATLPSL